MFTIWAFSNVVDANFRLSVNVAFVSFEVPVRTRSELFDIIGAERGSGERVCLSVFFILFYLFFFFGFEWHAKVHLIVSQGPPSFRQH